MNKGRAIAGAIFLGLLSLTCYPVQQTHQLSKAALHPGTTQSAPTKVHLLDGSVVLFNDGFHCDTNMIKGFGDRYDLSRTTETLKYWYIPLDSVLGLEYFDKTVPGARIPGTVVLTTIITAPLAIVVGLAIFGSCPTIYTSDGKRQMLEAECFPASIGRQCERPDLDRLEQREPSSGTFTVRMKNEALETQYIDAFHLGYVDHPAGTEVFPTEDRDVLVASNLSTPISATNSEGTDVSSVLRYRDDIVYAIDSTTARRMFQQRTRDWVECKLAVPRTATSVTVALRGRNSLVSTVLLYDVMMRDQGLHSIEWAEKLNGNLLYAWRLGEWYKTFSGIEISVEHDGKFVTEERIHDVGPIAWKPTAARIPLGEHGDTVRIRLSFLPDSWKLDWIGFDAQEHETPEFHQVKCARVQDNVGRRRDDAVSKIAGDDGRYLVTYPGEWLDLAFDLPPKTQEQRTMFVYSKGYYVEWVRPEWVRERADVPGFDLSNPQAIRARLAQLWSAKKTSFERDFFDHKFPTVEPGKSW